MCILAKLLLFTSNVAHISVKFLCTQKVDLDGNGSREILVERWKDYLRTTNNEYS